LDKYPPYPLSILFARFDFWNFYDTLRIDINKVDSKMQKKIKWDPTLLTKLSKAGGKLEE